MSKKEKRKRITLSETEVYIIQEALDETERVVYICSDDIYISKYERLRERIDSARNSIYKSSQRWRKLRLLAIKIRIKFL